MVCEFEMDLKNFFVCAKKRSGVENYIFWSEIGSGFGELGSTPQPRTARSTYLHGSGTTCDRL